MSDPPVHPSRERTRRRDAQANRERLLEAAVRAIARDGFRVPVAVIAADAGLGVATFYRSFADRGALMRELEERAYAHVIRLLDDLERRGLTGLDAVHEFLLGSLRLGDRLILPLHGAPPLVDAAAVDARERIDNRIERFLEDGRRAAAIGPGVNATDVIMCSALITQPLQHGPSWERTARRHIALFVAGIASGRPLEEPPVLRVDVERSFQARARDVT